MICLESVLQKLHQQPIIDQYITPSLISNKLMLNNINDMLDMVQIDEGKLKISKMNFQLASVIDECMYIFKS